MKTTKSMVERKHYNLSNRKHWGGEGAPLYEDRGITRSLERRVLLYLIIRENHGTVKLHYLDFGSIVDGLLDDIAMARSESELCAITIRDKEHGGNITLQRYAFERNFGDSRNDLSKFELVERLVQAWMDFLVEKCDNSTKKMLVMSKQEDLMV